MFNSTESFKVTATEAENQPMIKEGVEREYEKIDLSKPEGLQAFAESVEAIYADAMELTSFLDSTPVEEGEDLTGEEILNGLKQKFTKLSNLISHYQDVLLPSGIDISEEELVEIQDLYNDLLILRDYILDNYGNTKRLSDKAESQVSVFDEIETGNDNSDFFIGRVSKRISVDNIEEPNDGNIAISTAVRAEDRIFESEDYDSAVVQSNITEDEKMAIGYIEHKDPINESIVDEDVLPEKIEKILNNEINKVETSELDRFERYLGENYTSSFEYLQDKSIAEIYELLNSEDLDLRKKISNQGMKYEIFVAWIDKIPEMQSIIGEDEDMTFGELFTRFVLVTKVYN